MGRFELCVCKRDKRHKLIDPKAECSNMPDFTTRVTTSRYGGIFTAEYPLPCVWGKRCGAHDAVRDIIRKVWPRESAPSYYPDEWKQLQYVFEKTYKDGYENYELYASKADLDLLEKTRRHWDAKSNPGTPIVYASFE